MNSSQPAAFIVSGTSGLRRELHSMLTARGVNATALGSAAAYLTHAKRGTAACLIVDVDLPDMSGFVFQELVRGTDASVVIVSQAGNIGESVRAVKLGAIDYLTAPVDSDSLLRAVRVAFARDRIFRQQRRCLASLTPREREVANLVVRGLRNKMIAANLGISTVTVQIHRCNVMRKMSARSLPDLVRMGDALGFSAPAL